MKKKIILSIAIFMQITHYMIFSRVLLDRSIEVLRFIISLDI